MPEKYLTSGRDRQGGLFPDINGILLRVGIKPPLGGGPAPAGPGALHPCRMPIRKFHASGAGGSTSMQESEVCPGPDGILFINSVLLTVKLSVNPW